jgi:hypothetical protein
MDVPHFRCVVIDGWLRVAPSPGGAERAGQPERRVALERLELIGDDGFMLWPSYR